MPEFLNLLPPADALDKLISHLPASSLPAEKIFTAEGLGRVTRTAVIAPEDLPGFSRSTVDGFAVRAADTFGASESLPAYLPLVGSVPMGAAPDFTLPRGSAAEIHTGGMLPDGADAVVMLENTQTARPGELEVLRAVGVYENILKAGEDVSAGQEVLPAGVTLRPAEIGGLMALGLTEIGVVRRPRVGILSSGDEVVEPDLKVKPGQVRDINSYSLSGLVEQAGGIPVRYGVVVDRIEEMQTSLAQALDACDLVVVTAGSSASSRDLTAEVINRMGSPGVLVHGVNVRPGKPTILAVCNGKAVIGLPGNPVSALVIAGLFVVPVIDRLLGRSKPERKARVQAQLSVNLASQAGREDYIPVQLKSTSKGWVAEPIFYKSNLIFTLTRADGLICIPANATGLAAGTSVEIELF